MRPPGQAGRELRSAAGGAANQPPAPSSLPGVPGQALWSQGLKSDISCGLSALACKVLVCGLHSNQTRSPSSLASQCHWLCSVGRRLCSGVLARLSGQWPGNALSSGQGRECGPLAVWNPRAWCKQPPGVPGPALWLGGLKGDPSCGQSSGTAPSLRWAPQLPPANLHSTAFSGHCHHLGSADEQSRWWGLLLGHRR